MQLSTRALLAAAAVSGQAQFLDEGAACDGDLSKDCNFNQNQECLGPVDVKDDKGVAVPGVANVCAAKDQCTPSAAGTKVTFTAGAAGKYADGTAYTVTTVDGAKCQAGGQTGKTCVNQEGCAGPDYKCDALVLGGAVVT